VHAQDVLKIENFMPCDESLWSNGRSTGANNLNIQSSITFGSAKSTLTLGTYKKEKSYM
jgi:hypothetical protein